jgi:hypothetical protein
MNQDEHSEPTSPEAPTVIETEQPPTPLADAASEPAKEAVSDASEPDSEPKPTETVPAPVPLVTPTPASVKPPHSHKRLALIITAVLIVLLAEAAAFVVSRNNKTITQPSAAAKTVHKAAKPVASLPPTSGFTDSYLDAPQLLSPQPSLFTDLTAIGYDCGTPATATNPGCHITYSKIGTTKGGKPILLVDNGEQGEAAATFLALQTGTDQYALLLNPTGTTSTDATQVASLKKAVKPNVTVDTTTRLIDLKFDQNVTYQGAALTIKDSSGFTSAGYVLPQGLASLRGGYFGVTDTSKVTKLGSYGAQTVYQAVAQQDANYKVEELYFSINQVYADQYYLDSALNDSKSPPLIKWTNGDINSDGFTYRAAGCGSYGGYLVAKGINQNDLTKTGTGPNGEELYSVATDSALFQEIYNNDYGSGESLQDASLKNLTAAQFQAKHAVFLTKNGFGELVIYQDSKFLSGGGCGKPVVYLYPTHTTSVNVSVGADVQQSEPQYPAGGWEQVLAQPNGQLTYQGQQYPNLFWEGIGHGQYPIVNSGTVVRSSEAVATIRHQLTQQGLKANEINDFMDYWQPRLPHSAYVRLTWFNTKQMDQLAPLTIVPKPTTTIRVFLDFEGLDRQIPLAKQHFSAPARTGFTAVEWGGLDRSFDKR